MMLTATVTGVVHRCRCLFIYACHLATCACLAVAAAVQFWPRCRVQNLSFLCHSNSKRGISEKTRPCPSIPQDQIWRPPLKNPASKCGEGTGGLRTARPSVSSLCTSTASAHSFLSKELHYQPWPPRRRSASSRPRRSRCVSLQLLWLSVGCALVECRCMECASWKVGQWSEVHRPRND